MEGVRLYSSPTFLCRLRFSSLDLAVCSAVGCMLNSVIVHVLSLSRTHTRTSALDSGMDKRVMSAATPVSHVISRRSNDDAWTSFGSAGQQTDIDSF